MTEAILEKTQDNLKDLKLFRMVEVLEGYLEKASKEEWTYGAFLHELTQEQCEAKKDKTIEVRMSHARFPYVKTLEGFDFKFQPSVDSKRVRELALSHYIHHGENVIFLGPPGVGKTHLAIALGVKAIRSGFSVLFIQAQVLLNNLAKAHQENRLEEKLKAYQMPKLLIIDEIGYIPIDRTGANLFFQLVSRRYERGAVILTSNQSFMKWGDVFGDRVLATAILDRLLHHSTVLNIKGESFRLREKKKSGLWQETREKDES
jgi:DNA replication protein DnaC